MQSDVSASLVGFTSCFRKERPIFLFIHSFIYLRSLIL